MQERFFVLSANWSNVFQAEGLQYHPGAIKKNYHNICNVRFKYIPLVYDVI